MVEPKRNPFSREQRVRKQRAFDRVFQARAVKRAGPLRVHAARNEQGQGHRLGLSVSRRVGNAVKRNRVKRLLREAFRLLQHELPGDYDFVVVVSPHRTQMLADYQRLFADAAERLHRHWEKRRRTAEEAHDAR